MNASNVLELIKPQGGKSVVETMTNNLAAVEEQARRLGRPILGHLNHPNFGYAITAEELAMVTKERFFEVYNGHPGVHHQGDEHARRGRADVGHHQHPPHRRDEGRPGLRPGDRRLAQLLRHRAARRRAGAGSWSGPGS